MRTPSLLLALWLTTFAAERLHAQGQWERLPNSPVASTSEQGRFDDLEAVTPDSLWVIDIDGPLYRSSDGGDSWTEVADLGFRGARSLAFVNSQVGWIGTLGGADRVLFETRNGGETLTNISERITGPTPSSLCGLFALDDKAVYGVGGIAGGAYFIHTLDAGQTWTSTDLSAVARFLIDVYFFDRTHGLAVGIALEENVAIVLGTKDGGTTWEERFRSDGSDEWGWKISFPSPEVGYVSVENFSFDLGKVLKTTDGGQTWEALPMPVQSMQGIGFITPERGWVGGRGVPVETTDGGATWTSTDELGISANRFQFFGDSLGFAVANHVYRYRTGEPVAVADPLPLPTTVQVHPAYPNPFPERVLLPYYLPRPATVSLDVFDVRGRRVASVDRGLRPAGPDELLWWARDERGRPLPAGVYLYRIRTGDAVTTGRVVKAGN